MAKSENDAPLCFVAMPFGRKEVAGFTAQVDFDAVYEQVLAPAIQRVGMAPIRADEEQSGGFIHKPMFERLLFCSYVIADLTGANPNVFYEVGIRHAVKPYSTVLVFAESTRLPFDIAPMRGCPYRLNADGTVADPAAAIEIVAERLRAAKADNKAEPLEDSPLYQLVDGMKPPQIERLKTDVFRERVSYENAMKSELAAAREKGEDAVRAVHDRLVPLVDREAGVVIDLFLSYRAVKAWEAMVAVVDEMRVELQKTVLVREQLGFAYNRAGRSADAERVLEALVAERGPSSETLGILGRIYKDRWEHATNDAEKQALLRRAIQTYHDGFLADPRDAYPGINAVTLMDVAGDPRGPALIPVVEFAVRRRLSGKPDYWDHATLLELAVLARDEQRAHTHLGDALSAVRESWEPESTAGNLRLLASARGARGEDTTALDGIVRALVEKEAELRLTARDPDPEPRHD